MARTVRNAKLDTRSARTKLTARREPYWTSISKGRSLGYRRGAKGGTWIARYRDDGGKQHHRALGAADDVLDGNGTTVLSFADAQRLAHAFFAEMDRLGGNAPIEGYTVAMAMADYLKAYAVEGKAVDRTASVIDTHILPTLGEIELRKLRKQAVADWRDALISTPARVRSRRNAAPAFKDATPNDPEAARRRKSTANRCLTVLKAALNRAYADGKVANDDAWKMVKPFKSVDAARIRFLSDEEARRLVNATTEPFRSMVVAALLTGCRYGELCALEVADVVHAPNGSAIMIRDSKSAEPRSVALTDEGATFFETACAGKVSSAPVFEKLPGRRWQHADQIRPIRVACQTAKIDPPITFHGLRHTYASRLVMAGAPLVVVARQLGHQNTRMVEKHYGHLAADYVSETVRAHYSAFEIELPETVVPITTKRR